MSHHRDHLEELARDIDMVVFRLERAADAERWSEERRRVRRELERLRDNVEEMARKL